MATNLPPNAEFTDSADRTKLVFDSYGQKQSEYRAIDVDATIAFFQKRGFSDPAAEAVSIVLLEQARIEKINVMSILDSIKNTNNVQLSEFVSQVLNNNRVNTSTLGVRIDVPLTNQTRNIVE